MKRHVALVLMAVASLSAGYCQGIQMFAVTNLTRLRAVVGTNAGDTVLLQGYYRAGDGGGGAFVWDPSASTADDAGINIAPEATPVAGRWRRLDRMVVNARWFGAVGDGVVNDRSSLQRAADYLNAQGGGKLLIPRGRYLLADPDRKGIELGDASTLEGDGGSTVIISKGYVAIRNLNSDEEGGVNRDIFVRHLTIDCGYEGVNGVWLGSVINGGVENVRIANPLGYGVWIYRGGDSLAASGEGTPSKGIAVTRCHITGVVDVGIELSGPVGCSVIGNYVSGLNGIAGYYAWNGARDCVFVGNTAEGEGDRNGFIGYQAQPRQIGRATETQGIQFTGNVGRNVFVGFMTRGRPNYTATDITFADNQLSSSIPDANGIVIDYARRVTIRNNHIADFTIPLRQGSSVADTGIYKTGSHIVYERNKIVGGGTSLLYGNSGGSLAGNRFDGIGNHAVRLYAWHDCSIIDNVFINLGSSSFNFGLILQAYAGDPTANCVITGNRAFDDRETKFTYGAVLADSTLTNSVVIGNTVAGVMPGGKGYYQLGDGTNNLISGNISMKP